MDVRKKSITSIFMALLLGLLLVLAGCSSQESQGTQESNTTETPEANSAADDFPAKPVTWVIPFDAGSGADTFARTLGKAAEKNLGRNFVFINKPGGSGGIALSYLETQATDGYTIASHSSSLVYALASGQIPFKVDDIDYLVRINADPEVLAVPSSSSFKSLDDLVAYAKSNPGKMNVGGVGAFSTASVCSDLFKQTAGVDYKYIPFDGGNEATVAVLGANVDAAWLTSNNAAAQVEAGKLRLLATANSTKNEKQPDVPTFKEKGYDFESILWRGVIALPGIPENRIQILQDAFEKALQDPEWLAYMENEGQIDAYLPAADFAVAVKKEFADAEKAASEQVK
ncbi:MAG: tripartite tricarboxylate transporter substrate binding protein [Dehalobacterium sp.]